MATPSPTWVDTAPLIEPRLYGLFSVAQILEDEGPWQQRGVEYFTEACAQGGFVVGSCPEAVAPPDLTAQITATPTGTGITLGSAGAANMPVNYSFTPTVGDPVWGTLAAGASIALELDDGTYTFGLQATGGALTTRPITVPGAPVVYTVHAPGVPTGATTHDKPVTNSPTLTDGSSPFTVYARAECRAVGFDDATPMARRLLAGIEEREVERFFSQYVLGEAAPDFPLLQAATPLKRAIGVLEQHAALNYAGAPTLHVARWANPYLENRNLLQANSDTDPVRRTHLGSRVAFGGGYYDNPFDPTDPPADGQFWLVATGSVRARRSAAFDNETFTPQTNIRMAIAERTYALDADCYRAAVLVTVEGED